MICKECGLEMKIISEILITREGNNINTRSPKSYRCSNGHTEYRNYDNLK